MSDLVTLVPFAVYILGIFAVAGWLLYINRPRHHG